jgi:YD repeat-containing protein
MKLTFRAIQEQILDSITEKGTIVYTNEKNMYIVRSDGTKMKVSDNIFVEDESVLNDLPQKFTDKIYITKNNWKMYTWDGTVFKLLSGGGGSGGGIGGISETQRETISVSEGQTSIKSPFSFPMGGSLKVYKNGVLLDLNKDYTETNSDYIEVMTPTSSTDLFTFMLELSGVIKLEPTSYRKELEYNTDGKVTKETYTGGVNKVINYEYDTKGNVTKQTTVRDGQNFVTTYNYDANGNITSVDDGGSEIAVLSTSSGTLKGIKPITYHLELVYNSDGSIGKEIYTGDINKTASYFYYPDGRINYKEVLDSEGQTRKATYNYDTDGNIVSIDDEGTDLITVEGSGSQTQSSPVTVTQDDIKGKLVGSLTLTDDIAFLVNTINDLIANQELLENEIETLKNQNNPSV